MLDPRMHEDDKVSNKVRQEDMNKLNQKGIAHLIILVILMVLVLGLVAGVYLVQNTQIFKPKAEDLTNKSSVNQTQVEVDVKQIQ